jgi:DNA polymerase-1
MSEVRTCYLIDGHNLLYRAHFAFIRNPLFNSKGLNTSVPFGFTRMLNTLLAERAPDHLGIVFDSAEPSFRRDLYAEYKAHRAPMPREIAEAIPVVRDIVRAYGIPIIEVPGFEADDVLATIARRLADAGHHVYIISGDKDLLQLVDERIHVLTTRRGLTDLVEMDRDAVIAKYGVPPEQFADLLALMGDTSDNIPGVRGIGPKTASALLKRFPSVEALIERSSEIPNARQRGMIEASVREIKASKELATICTDVEIDLQIDDLRIGRPSKERLIELFSNLEFHQLLGEIVEPTSEEESRYELVTTLERLRDVIQAARASGRLAFDTETTALDAMSAELVGISLAWAPHHAGYIPLAHESYPAQLAPDAVRELLAPLLADPGIEKFAHNLKFDWTMLSRHGYELGGPLRDTMIAAYLLNPGRRQYGLDALASEYLKLKKTPYKELMAQVPAGGTIAAAPLDRVCDYACEDADAALRLWDVLGERLRDAGLFSLFEEVEMPLVDVLRRMELAGIALDVERLGELSRELAERIGELEREAVAIVGHPFNLNSPKQLNRVLFEELGYSREGLRSTRWGVSTDEQSLRRLWATQPEVSRLPELLLEHRTLAKLKGTYVDVLPRLVREDTGRLHTSFNQTVAETGRLSSSEPNLQNIPARGEWGPRIRAAFVAEPGKVLISADYSQVELRILAHMSGDPGLIEAFRQGRDIHAATASRIFGVPLEEVTPELRRAAKAVNFGIDYGMTLYGLATRLGIDRRRAQEFIDNYFARFPGVAEYIERTWRRAEEEGYVETMLGRRRYIPGLRSKTYNVREAAKRQAINMPIQGSAADLIKVAMIRVDRHIRERAPEARMILQVHDELLFEAPEGMAEELAGAVRGIMEGAAKLVVPLVVDVSIGRHWGEIH